MDEVTKIVYQRLALIKRVQRSGNVSKACKELGISRTLYYRHLKRWETDGIEGLKDRPPIHKTHPFTIPVHHKDRLIALSLEHPGWGCDKLRTVLHREGISISSPTIQTILKKHGISTRRDRAFYLERKWRQGLKNLTPEQIELIEKINPCFRERDSESKYPGAILVQGIIRLKKILDDENMYLHAVVDTYCSYAFLSPPNTDSRRQYWDMLEEKLFPFYNDKGLWISVVLTGGENQFIRKGFDSYVGTHWRTGVKYRVVRRKNSPMNGFFERFKKTFLTEFVQPFNKGNKFENVDRFNNAIQNWLEQYNNLRPHRGYRNMGKTPNEMIEQYNKVRIESYKSRTR